MVAKSRYEFMKIAFKCIIFSHLLRGDHFWGHIKIPSDLSKITLFLLNRRREMNIKANV